MISRHKRLKNPKNNWSNKRNNKNYKKSMVNKSFLIQIKQNNLNQ